MKKEVQKKGNNPNNIFWRNRIIFVTVLLIITFALSVIFGYYLNEKIEREKNSEYTPRLPLDFSNKTEKINLNKSIVLPLLSECLQNKSLERCNMVFDNLGVEKCKEMGDLKTVCYKEFSRIATNEESCEATPLYKNECYFKIATREFNQKMCEKIDEEKMQEECIQLATPPMEEGEII